MARETGLEPAASAVTGRRSNQLSYSRNPESHGRRSARRHIDRIRDARAGVKPLLAAGGNNPASSGALTCGRNRACRSQGRYAAGFHKPLRDGNRSSEARRAADSPAPSG